MWKMFEFESDTLFLYLHLSKYYVRNIGTQFQLNFKVIWMFLLLPMTITIYNCVFHTVKTSSLRLSPPGRRPVWWGRRRPAGTAASPAGSAGSRGRHTRSCLCAAAAASSSGSRVGAGPRGGCGCRAAVWSGPAGRGADASRTATAAGRHTCRAEGGDGSRTVPTWWQLPTLHVQKNK